MRDRCVSFHVERSIRAGSTVSHMLALALEDQPARVFSQRRQYINLGESDCDTAGPAGLFRAWFRAPFKLWKSNSA